jgi:hypothetical protein
VPPFLYSAKSIEAEAAQNTSFVGDVFWVSQDDRISEAANAIHIEASPPVP